MWGSDAREWRPERFDGFDATGLNWSFLPFINGPRTCLGKFFALLEGRIVLARLLQRYDMSLAPGQTGERHPYKIPVCPCDGMRLTLKERKL